MNKRVFVGMSGGVDSSVAALRLIRAGYDVVGVFIKVWQPDFIHCDWEKERLDAMRVAAHLGIPFLTFDAEAVYKREVADYMIDAYRAGFTPNPDVMCNEHVKFGAFYRWARERGAHAIATGHYARTQTQGGTTHLLKGIDPGKDQSYFLWRITQDALNHTLFPVGDTLKHDIRKEAERARIPTAQKADSQGICFLGEIDMYTFLSHFISLNEGAVLDPHGSVIGTHRGALLYTTGQRHGFVVTGSTTHTPHYVVDRDLTRNTITVSTQPPHTADLTCTLTDCNELGAGWTSTMDAVPRYHGTPIPVHVTYEHNGSAILTPTSNETCTWVRGQSCVLYRGDACVGGGVIM